MWSENLTKNILFALFIGVLAAGINLFRLPLFFEAEFLFGQFLVLLIAVFRGPIMGLLACTIATIPLIFAWGSLWGTITFGLEAVFIGIICRHNRNNLVLAVVAYWIFIGMPVSWYSISQYEYFLDSHRTAILIKQLTNGIIYAHIAAMVIYLPSVKKYFVSVHEDSTPSIKEQSSHIISSLLITMGILFFFYSLLQNIRVSSDKYSQSHHVKHDKLNYQLSLIVEKKLEAINELKYTLSNVWNDIDAREKALTEFNQRHPAFKTMLLADINGQLINSSPSEFALNVMQSESFDLSDRDYFQQALKSKDVYVSPGFEGRGFGNDLIAAVSVAVPNKESSQVDLGVVEGSFILSSLKLLQDAVDEILPSVDAILVDQNNRVLISSKNLKLQSLSKLNFKKAVSTYYDHDLVNLVDVNNETKNEVYFYQESKFNWGWKLVTLQNEYDFAYVIKQTLVIFAISIVLMVLIAKLLAWSISHYWLYYMQRLNQLVDRGEGFENELAEFEANDQLPEEVKNLYLEIKRSRLKIVKMNQDLQNTVAERTEKLQALNNKLNIIVKQDSLTQLGNRRVFNDTLNEAWVESQKELVLLSLLVIDVDYFKKINDTYGHPVGDEVLVKLAKLLRVHKTPDVKCLARIGGEEFSLLLKISDHQTAVELAENIRSHIEESVINVGIDKTLRITVSIGVATINPTKYTSSRLYQLADNALYEAKNAGRNKVKDINMA